MYNLGVINPSQKLKGIQTLTHKEQLAPDTMKALKESKKTNRRQPGNRGSSEGTGTKPRVLDKEKVTSEANLVHADEQVNDDEDEEMTNAEDADTRNGDEEIIDTTKVDAEKTEVERMISRKLNFLQQAPAYITVKDTTDAKINSLLDVQIQQEIPQIQSPSILTIPVSVISEPSVLTPIPETPSVAPATTLLPPSTVSSISQIASTVLLKHVKGSKVLQILLKLQSHADEHKTSDLLRCLNPTSVGSKNI
ncbi:hypothetical protein Tco_1088557 [Tanacetum coccineum]